MSLIESTLPLMVRPSLNSVCTFPNDFFTEIMQASRGAVKITIISAEALSKKHLEKVQASLTAFVGAGKPVSGVTDILECSYLVDFID